MKVDTDNLISVQSYAQQQSVSVQSVYRWINNNVVKAVEIDGVKFIITKNPSKD
jgi:intergrase/recombinase